MKFHVVINPAKEDEREVVYLTHTGWDDWYKYSTKYYAEYVDSDGVHHEIGFTKIGMFGLLPARNSSEVPDDARSPRLKKRFSNLGNKYFSLGQDADFYENLSAIGPEFRKQTLKALRDIAYDPSILAKAENEDVTRVSLLRTVPMRTVREQFNRLADGGVRLSPFKLKFDLGYTKTVPAPRIAINVTPGSMPPSNIHAIIGRNGVGKSLFLNNLARHYISKAPANAASTAESRGDIDATSNTEIANVVSVSFSAFDSFEPLSLPQDRSGCTYHYVGLKKMRTKTDDPEAIKGLTALATEMTKASRVCFEGARKECWLRGLRLLESDPVFAAVGIADAIESAETLEEVRDFFSRNFKRLSSGHKIVLLTITKLVETVEEASLVLLDEPEAHLHPPLLSAFVRALSDLLVNRNGVAIVATHSPVVLQEVPQTCAWILNRIGDEVVVKRPEIETFGENVGTLTNEVFGLEVTGTGFHRLLSEAAEAELNYENALALFDGKIGTEGKALLRAMTISLESEHVER